MVFEVEPLVDKLGHHKCTWVDRKGTWHVVVNAEVDPSQPTFQNHVSYPLKQTNKQTNKQKE